VVGRVNESLSIGSRPSASDDCGEFDVIIDMTAEFQEVKRVRERPGYFCFPILDASAPTVDALEKGNRDSANSISGRIRSNDEHCESGCDFETDLPANLPTGPLDLQVLIGGRWARIDPKCCKFEYSGPL